MRNLHRHKASWTALVLSAALASAGFVNSASGSILLGNLPQTNDAGEVSIGKFSAIFAGGQGAYQFTLPGLNFTLDDVHLRLQNLLTGGPPLVTIRAADNGSAPGSLIATLSNSTPLADALEDYTFLPAGVVNLQANTSYWLLVDHATNTTSFSWLRSNPSLVPAGSATYERFAYSNNNGASYFDSPDVLPSFQIDATASGVVPEAAGLVVWTGLGACGMALMLLKARSHQFDS